MDIKQRIDKLSDMEICAAEICPYWAVCDEEGYDSCCAVWLGEAQKGAQE